MVFVCCKQQRKKEGTSRIEYIRGLVKKVGIQALPYNYDMAKHNTGTKYSVDRTSMDTLFFDDLNGSVEGALPDTSVYFGFIY
jgi:hypothetical protein